MQYDDSISGIDAIRQRLLDNIRRDLYAGYDPFDGLNSKLFKMSGLARFPFARLAWIQLFKRSPTNLRPLVGVPKHRNAKAIALIIMGMLQDYTRTKDQVLLAESKELGNWLLEHCCLRDVWKYYCWGYPFPWQARAFFVPDWHAEYYHHLLCGTRLVEVGTWRQECLGIRRRLVMPLNL